MLVSREAAEYGFQSHCVNVEMLLIIRLMYFRNHCNTSADMYHLTIKTILNEGFSDLYSVPYLSSMHPHLARNIITFAMLGKILFRHLAASEYPWIRQAYKAIEGKYLRYSYSILTSYNVITEQTVTCQWFQFCERAELIFVVCLQLSIIGLLWLAPRR